MMDIDDEAADALRKLLAIVESSEAHVAELAAAAVNGGVDAVHLVLERIVSEQLAKADAVFNNMATALAARRKRAQQSPSDKLH